MEDLRDQFKVFGEALSVFDSKNERRFNEIDEKFDRVNNELGLANNDLSLIKNNLNRVDEKFEVFKTELAMIRHRLVGPEEISMLESRISILEKKVR